MGVWGIVAVTLAGCSSAEEPTTAVDTSPPEGIDREPFDRLFRDRYCGQWAICNTTGSPCPIPVGTSAFPLSCEFDGVAAQACIVNDWGCEGGSPGYEYPLLPPLCSEVCGGYDTNDYGGSGGSRPTF